MIHYYNGPCCPGPSVHAQPWARWDDVTKEVATGSWATMRGGVNCPACLMWRTVLLDLGGQPHAR